TAGFKKLNTLYFALVWLFGFYTAMAPGANVNALLEAWVLTAMLAALAVNRLVESWTEMPVPAKATVLLLWVSIAAVSVDVWRVLISMHPPNMYAQLAQGIESHRVLSDIPYVAAHGRQPELLDPSVNHY